MLLVLEAHLGHKRQLLVLVRRDNAEVTAGHGGVLADRDKHALVARKLDVKYRPVMAAEAAHGLLGALGTQVPLADHVIVFQRGGTAVKLGA